MLDERLDKLASALLEARRTGIPLPPLKAEDLPRSVDEAYAVQDEVSQHSGETRGGWKIGCTSEASQRYLGADAPIIGAMPLRRIFESGARVDGEDPRYMVEAEFAFRLDADLPPRDTDYSREEVLAALGPLYPAIEVVQGRFSEQQPPILAIISDDAGAGSLILGAPVEDWRNFDLPGQAVELLEGGATLRSGHGRDVLGDPVTAMVWAANCLSGRGIGLRAGEVVTTGTCAAPAFVPRDVLVTADFGPLGNCMVTFISPASA